MSALGFSKPSRLSKVHERIQRAIIGIGMVILVGDAGAASCPAACRRRSASYVAIGELDDPEDLPRQVAEPGIGWLPCRFIPAHRLQTTS